jgi:hypothetical protein
MTQKRCKYIYLFICGLLNGALNSSKDEIINEYRNGKDVEESGSDLI